MHPGVRDGEERAIQRRLLMVSLCGPLLLAAALAQVTSTVAGLPVMLAAICIVFVVGWTSAVAIAQTATRTVAGPVLLVAAIAPAATVIHSAGGLGAPLFLAWLPLLLEPWLALRSRAALGAGLAAAVAAVALAIGLGVALPQGEVAAAGWQWVLPVLYGLTLWRRLGGVEPAADANATVRPLPRYEEIVPTVTFRMKRSGEVVDCAGQVWRLLRLDPAFLCGSGLLDRVHVADRIAYLGALADLREGARARMVDLRLRLPAEDGEGEMANYRAFLLHLMADGADDDFVAVLRDNEEVVRLRTALEEAKSQAEIGKARFLATVSHELRTPLNAIIGFSDMLLADMAGPLADPRQRDYVTLVRDSGGHLLEVVNAILDVAKIESGTYPILPETFRLGDALETSLAITGYAARVKGVTLRDETVADAEAQPGQSEVFADRRALQQILINLLSNAVKFTPAGGTVTLTARSEPRRLTLTVRDTGIGMSADELDRIGKPFVQVFNDYARAHEGTGLGLSLVKGLVALQEGTLTIDSAPGEGTVVTVSLPVRTIPRHQDRTDADILAIPQAARQRTPADETLRKSA